MADLPSPTLTLDAGALARNFAALRAEAAGVECAGVVKADAYGIGLDVAAPALRAAGAKTFFVAHGHEGLRLRPLVGDAAIYVLNGLQGDDVDAFLRSDLRPVLNSVEDVERFSALSRTRGVKPKAALHIDTGMHRLGLDLHEAAVFSESGPRARAFDLALIMTHFACADTPDHPLNAKQITRFRQMRGLFSGVPGSMANSAGLFLGREARHDLIRPGIAVYGGRFATDRPALEPVASLSAPILMVRDVREGEGVGYGATHLATRKSRIAVLAVGYADGYPRLAGNRAEAVVLGQRCPWSGAFRWI